MLMKLTPDRNYDIEKYANNFHDRCSLVGQEVICNKYE